MRPGHPVFDAELDAAATTLEEIAAWRPRDERERRRQERRQRREEGR